jgi:hypothetical protein
MNFGVKNTTLCDASKRDASDSKTVERTILRGFHKLLHPSITE